MNLGVKICKLQYCTYKVRVLFDDALGRAYFLAGTSVSGWFFRWRELFRVDGFWVAFLRTSSHHISQCLSFLSV